MADWIAIKTPHGPVSAWRDAPHEPSVARGAVVLVQEIFGVNGHIRDVASRLAVEGFEVLAPALFDPIERDVELGYDAEGVARGRALVDALGFERAVAIIDAAAVALDRPARTAAMGFCWGGTLALLANTRLGLPAVSYYGGRSVPFLGERLRAPMLLHFGRRDPIIPPADVALHREKLVGAEIHEYDAGHGFNCDRRADFDPAASALAWQRSIDFLRRALA